MVDLGINDMFSSDNIHIESSSEEAPKHIRVSVNPPEKLDLDIYKLDLDVDINWNSGVLTGLDDLESDINSDEIERNLMIAKLDALSSKFYELSKSNVRPLISLPDSNNSTTTILIHVLATIQFDVPVEYIVIWNDETLRIASPEYFQIDILNLSNNMKAFLFGAALWSISVFYRSHKDDAL